MCVFLLQDGSGTMERDEFIEFLNVKVTDSNPKKDDKESSRSKFETEFNEVYLHPIFTL